MKYIKLFEEYLNEGTFSHPDVMSIISSQEDGDFEVEKRGKGYEVNGDDWGFTAKNKKELIKKMKDYNMKVIVGSLDQI